MTLQADDPFSGALTHVDRLPLAWQPLPRLPTEPELAEANRSLVALLGLIGSLDEPPPSVEEIPELAAPLLRLNQKLDLALELLGQLLARERVPPPAVQVCLSARGVSWRPDPVPAAGPGWLTLHLLPHVPKALELPALLQSRPDGTVVAEFQGVEPPLGDALERFVFRRHRRAIAQAKRPTDAG